MNRIDQLFREKNKMVLSIYITAGYPQLDDTVTIIKQLEEAGADMVEIGIPFSDPMADGVVIQKSSDSALRNGMSLRYLFEQLKDIRKEVTLPLILMGYLNPVLQLGMDHFLEQCRITGIDGVILPDLPLKEYEKEYQTAFKANQIYPIFLATPDTSVERLKVIDGYSKGFLYCVSSSSTTGSSFASEHYQTPFFKQLPTLNLNNPVLIGFGISNRETFTSACKFANGAIIGSAFIKAIGEDNVNLKEKVTNFIKAII